ncbi:hypothetical protein K458DRAFT_409285 [Lentithecium fluviatile CBS 122367]|uniref:Uncharacterized protein n=1 Tax=Lentithecium fluviatile CBS 122367 TaxID=1168545 RepID=A0A6G1II92_9PLEO|nr:hypothetical protein K458DRAFT_409285 [Lentithecium fluviatile CBS 122367]
MVKVPQSGGDGHTFYMETTLGPGMVAFANDVRVRYQNTDFSTPTPTPTERSSSPASDVTSRFPPNEAPGSSVSGDAAAGNAGALSKTAYAGIGVAVAAVLVTLLAGFLVLARRRKEMRDSVPADAAELRDEWTRLQMLEMENAIPPQEMGLERGVAEVRGDVVASGELDGRRVAWELG